MALPKLAQGFTALATPIVAAGLLLSPMQAEAGDGRILIVDQTTTERSEFTQREAAHTSENGLTIAVLGGNNDIHSTVFNVLQRFERQSNIETAMFLGADNDADSGSYQIQIYFRGQMINEPINFPLNRGIDGNHMLASIQSTIQTLQASVDEPELTGST